MNVTDYSIALFVHIVGALGFFAALALEWTSVREWRRATTGSQARAWFRISTGAGRMAMVSMLLLLASGFHMMATVWGSVAWILVALGALALLIVLTLALTQQRISAIQQGIAAADGPLAPDLFQQLRHPALWFAVQLRVAVGLGVVYLMTIKPDLIASLFAIGVAAILGLLASLPALRQETPRPELST